MTKITGNGSGVSIPMVPSTERMTRLDSGNVHIITDECAWKSSKDYLKLHLRLPRNLPFEAFLQLTIVENAIIFAKPLFEGFGVALVCFRIE